MTEKAGVNNKGSIQGNAGFSLVELIICVAILAIASIPLYQSMTLSARTNARAQSKQNATSLAESLMEEIKFLSIRDLKAKYNGLSETVDAETGEADPKEVPLSKSESAFFGATVPIPDTQRETMLSAARTAAGGGEALLTGTGAVGAENAPFYVLYIPNAVSTQGEEFEAVATLRTSTYMKSGEGKAKATDASDANIKKLPRIDEIDTLSQAAISSKELTKYDAAALDYFRQNSGKDGKYDGTKSITSKEITITKENLSFDHVSVNCRVVYKDNSTDEEGHAKPKTFSRELFAGTFGASTKVEEGSTTVLPFASNIYIFYKRTQPNETININDASTRGTHKVFLVMQEDASISGTVINIRNSLDEDDIPLITLDSVTDLDTDGNMKSGDYELITNLGHEDEEGNYVSDGHLYKEESGIRIYDIDVTLYKNEKTVTTVESTKEANDAR